MMRPGRPRSAAGRQRRRWLVFVIVALAFWLLASFGVAYRLTRRPRPLFSEPAPAVAWGPLETHRIATSDGQQLGAWYAEGEDDAPSVLLLHGNGGSRWNCLGRASLLASEGGCAVLMVSLRAHGDSTGRVNDIGYSARRDVVAAVKFLRRRRPGKPVIILGVSMGAASALFAAEELNGLVRGYILESPYRDLKTAVWHRTEEALPPVLDRVAYLGLRVAAPVILPEFEAISTIRAIDRVSDDIPILILTGSRDRLARPAEAFALYERVRSHGRIEVIQGAGHHDFLSIAPQRYGQLVLDFCARAARTGRLSRRAASSPPSANGTAPDRTFDGLLVLMRGRLEVMHDVARWKWAKKVPIEDPEREAVLLRDVAAEGVALGLDPETTRAFFRGQIEAAKAVQRADFRRWEAARRGPEGDVPDLAGTLRPRIDSLNRKLLAALAGAAPRLRESDAGARLRSRADHLLVGEGIDAEVRSAVIAPLELPASCRPGSLRGPH